MVRVADNTVVETGTDRDQYVAILHGHIGFIRTVHAGHAEVSFTRGTIATETLQRSDTGNVETVDELVQFRCGVRQDNAATGINQRTFSLKHHLDGFANLSGMAFVDRLVGAHFDFLRIIVKASLHADVLRNIDQNRTGTACRGNVKCFFDGNGKILDIFDEEIVLDAWTCDTDRVAFLESVRTDCMG